MLTVPFQQMVSSSSWGAARSQSRQVREPVTLPNQSATLLVQTNSKLACPDVAEELHVNSHAGARAGDTPHIITSSSS